MSLTIEMELEIETPDEADPRYEGMMCFEVEVNCTDPVAPWSGSRYSCPSAADWYGEAAEFDGFESVRIFDLTVVDKDGKTGDMREANPYEVAFLQKWIEGEGQKEFDRELAEKAERLLEDLREQAEIDRYESRMDW